MGVISFLLLIGLCIHVKITTLHKDEIKDLRDENEELRKENVKKSEAFTKQNKALEYLREEKEELRKANEELRAVNTYSKGELLVTTSISLMFIVLAYAYTVKCKITEDAHRRKLKGW